MSSTADQHRLVLRDALLGAAAVLFPPGREEAMLAALDVLVEQQSVRGTADKRGLPVTTVRRAVRRLTEQMRVAELRIKAGTLDGVGASGDGDA